MNNAVFGKPMKETYSPVGKQPIKSEEAYQQAHFSGFPNFQRTSGGRSHVETTSLSQQTYLYGIYYIRCVQDTHVRLSLQLYEDKTWRQCSTVIHGYR